MKNIYKQKKGITLIALVITIIVLLILAGISISMLTGDNSILQKATEAKTNTEEKSKEEQIKLEVMGSYGTNGTIDVATLKTNLEKIGATVTGNSLPLTVTLGGQEFTIDTNGNVEKSVVYPIVSNTLKAGDFVEYNNKPYIVLYDMDSEYNWIEIVSVNPLESVTLGSNDITTGAQGTVGTFNRAVWSYNNAITNLNNIAQKYLDTDLADRARCVGSDPNNPLNEAETYPYNSYWLTIKQQDTNYQKDIAQLEAINARGITDSNYSYYWIASRTRNTDAKTMFGVNMANESNTIKSMYNDYENVLGSLFRATNGISDEQDAEMDPDRYFYNKTAGFRPVIRLISTTKITSGEGSISLPYKLSK